MIAESMYQELILEHYKHPQVEGLRDPYDAEVHHVNPTCGDEITMRVKLGDGGKVEDVSVRRAAGLFHQPGRGLGAARAGHRLDRRRQPRRRGRVHTGSCRAGERSRRTRTVLGDAVAFAGVAKFSPPGSKCALLAWMAYKDAVVRSTDNEARQ
ncbi:SUF system NifU family Fe-S cluster assembly protein [Streptosporangium vulgare]